MQPCGHNVVKFESAKSLVASLSCQALRHMARPTFDLTSDVLESSWKADRDVPTSVWSKPRVACGDALPQVPQARVACDDPVACGDPGGLMASGDPMACGDPIACGGRRDPMACGRPHGMRRPRRAHGMWRPHGTWRLHGAWRPRLRPNQAHGSRDRRRARAASAAPCAVVAAVRVEEYRNTRVSRIRLRCAEGHGRHLARRAHEAGQRPLGVPPLPCEMQPPRLRKRGRRMPWGRPSWGPGVPWEPKCGRKSARPRL